MIALGAGALDLARAWMTQLAGISPAMTGSLIAAVWQGIVLAALAGLTLRLLPKTPAAVRFAIWFGVFLVVTALPAFSLLWHSAGVAVAGGHSAWLVLDQRWSLAIAVLWVCASLGRAVTLLAAAARVRSLWKRARPVELAAVSRLGEKRKAQICVSDEVDRPTVIGFFSPRILIPGWLLEKLTTAELEQIVLHEAGHLGRADDWMNLLQKFALVIFPLNPALTWVEQRLCFERELAVDERVLQAMGGKPGAARAYAECLTTLAEYRLGRRRLALALGALGRESELGRRVGRILGRGERMRPVQAKLVLAGAILGLVVAATGFGRCPRLVGFSAPKTETVAQGGADQVRDGQLAVFSSARVTALNVSHKTWSPSSIQPRAQRAHETMTVALQPPSQAEEAAEAGMGAIEAAGHGSPNSAHVTQTMARITTSRDRSRQVSDVEPSQSAQVVMQLVVVSTWQGGEETRTVLTTANLPNAGRRAVLEQEAGGQPESSEQGHPYAAVPVRGGWLVFQL